MAGIESSPVCIQFVIPIEIGEKAIFHVCSNSNTKSIFNLNSGFFDFPKNYSWVQNIYHKTGSLENPFWVGRLSGFKRFARTCPDAMAPRLIGGCMIHRISSI